MKFQDYLKEYFKNENETRKDFCKRAGINIGTLATYLKDGDIRLLSFKKIVAALDHKIEIRPRKS